VGDDLELVVTHHLHRAFVLGQGVVEGDLFVRQSGLFAALAGRADVFGQLDEFLQHLGRGDGIGVIAGHRIFQPS